LIFNKQAPVIRETRTLFNFQRTQKNITSVSCCLCVNNSFRESSEEMMAVSGSRNVYTSSGSFLKSNFGLAPICSTRRCQLLPR